MACLLAMPAALALCGVAQGQNFYQLYKPRTYRIDPPLSPAMPNGLVPGALAYRAAGNGGAGSLLVGWQTPDGSTGEMLEVAVDLDTTPPFESDNDAQLLARVDALRLVRELDSVSDLNVVAISRASGTRLAAFVYGRFTTDVAGNVANMAVGTSSQPLPPTRLGSNIAPEGVALGGTRNIGSGVYTIAQPMFANDPAGLWVTDATNGKWVDADTRNTGGANDISPLLAWSGDTGTVNLDPDRHQLRAVDAVGYTSFLLTARRRDPNDAASIEYYLVQVNTLSQHVLAVAGLAEVFDARITSPSEAPGGGLDVTTRPDGTVRIALSTAGSGKYIGVVDGRLVAEGSPAVAGDTPTPTPGSEAVVWVCPGIGLGLPAILLAAGCCISHRLRRPSDGDARPGRTTARHAAFPRGSLPSWPWGRGPRR